MTRPICPHSVLGAVIGHQDDGDGGLLELRNCCGCRSTVSRAVAFDAALASGCQCATCRVLRVYLSLPECPPWCDCVGCEFRSVRRRRQRQAATEEANRRIAESARRLRGAA